MKIKPHLVRLPKTDGWLCLSEIASGHGDTMMAAYMAWAENLMEECKRTQAQLLSNYLAQYQYGPMQ